MPDFLNIELEEIAAARAGRTQIQFNEWFDQSEVKVRHKKSCMRQQGLRCCYCRKYVDTTNNNIWDLEHILDESTYPQFFTEALNLAVACKRCNGAKSSKDVLAATVNRPPGRLPVDSSEYTIPHPWLTTWTHHLSHVNYLVYNGLTEQGRVLINICALNSPALEKAKLSADAVTTAVRTGFFRVVGAQVPQNLDDTAVIRLSSGIVEAAEDQRRDVLLTQLDKKLVAMERAALRRNR